MEGSRDTEPLASSGEWLSGSSHSAKWMLLLDTPGQEKQGEGRESGTLWLEPLLFGTGIGTSLLWLFSFSDLELLGASASLLWLQKLPGTLLST